jgi:hypothetical protein
MLGLQAPPSFINVKYENKFAVYTSAPLPGLLPWYGGEECMAWSPGDMLAEIYGTGQMKDGLWSFKLGVGCKANSLTLENEIR